MEYERAVFRVYERCLDGMISIGEEGEENANVKSCKFVEFVLMVMIWTTSSVLFHLHNTFVGSPGCLPDLFQENNVFSASNFSDYISEDVVLLLNVDRDVYLPPNTNFNSYETEHIFRTDIASISGKSRVWKSTKRALYTGYDHMSRMLENPKRKRYDNSYGDDEVNATSLSTASASQISPQESFYDFKFAFDVGLLVMPKDMRTEHNFKVVNLTLSGGQCFGSAFTQNVIPMGGIDTVLMNMLVNTFPNTRGYLLSRVGAYYEWSPYDIHPYSDFQGYISFKSAIVIQSLTAFFFVSTISALLVRVLISSGVVIIFPFLKLMEYFGLVGFDMVRAMSMAYPWIGIPMEVIRHRQQSFTPFLIGHFSKVVLYYFLYESAQAVYASWFYRGDSPQEKALWLFAVMMIIEYYSMVYLRAALSIQLFPRVAMALFLIYHFYYYSCPTGFHMLALFIVFLIMCFMMVFCVRVFEVKAFTDGNINLDSPRMLYNALPWPMWRAALPQELTIFMPLNMRTVGLYNNAIPVPPGGGESAGTGASAAPRHDAQTVFSSGSPTADAAADTAAATPAGDSNNSIRLGTSNRGDIEMGAANSNTPRETSSTAAPASPESGFRGILRAVISGESNERAAAGQYALLPVEDSRRHNT